MVGSTFSDYTCFADKTTIAVVQELRYFLETETTESVEESRATRSYSVEFDPCQPVAIERILYLFQTSKAFI